MQTGIEWATITDPLNTNNVYMFDVTFFLSQHNCIYGRGCQGVNLNPSDGCCNIGVRTDTAEIHKVRRVVDMLKDQPQWAANSKKIEKEWFKKVEDEDDSYNTRLVGGACIFSNPADHEHPGCALFHAASANGIDVDDARPAACSSYPITFGTSEMDDKTITYVGPARRPDVWAEEGTGWWCVDDMAAYGNENDAAFVHYRPNVLRQCGELVTREFDKYMKARFDSVPEGYGEPLPRNAKGRTTTVPVTLTRKALK